MKLIVNIITKYYEYIQSASNAQRSTHTSMQKFSLVYTTVFTATISGYSSWYEIEDYAEEYKIEQVHKAFLEKSFEVTTGKYICLDGKTMRGVKKLDFDADSHCVAAFDPKKQASLAQVYIY